MLILNIESLIAGICIGIIYCIIMFNTCGKKPNICINRKFKLLNFLEIKNSSLYIKDYHIHHWCIFILISFLMYMYGSNYYIIYGFSLVLILQGLSYADRFEFMK